MERNGDTRSNLGAFRHHNVKGQLLLRLGTLVLACHNIIGRRHNIPRASPWKCPIALIWLFKHWFVPLFLPPIPLFRFEILQVNALASRHCVKNVINADLLFRTCLLFTIMASMPCSMSIYSSWVMTFSSWCLSVTFWLSDFMYSGCKVSRIYIGNDSGTSEEKWNVEKVANTGQRTDHLPRAKNCDR